MFPRLSRTALAVVLSHSSFPAIADQTAAPAAPPSVVPETVIASGAQTPPIEPAELSAAVKLPALTLVELKLLDEVTSKTAVAGAPVKLALARPIYLTPELGIAEGTPVEGVVIHAAKGGMGGKSGELLLGAKRIILSDTVHVPLRSFKLGPARGLNNETLAFATAVTVGLPALFINGGSAKIAPGTVANAKTSADTEIAVTLLSKLPPIAATEAQPLAVPAPALQPISTKGETK